VSVCRVTLLVMELTQRDFDQIPGENLRVSRAEFIAVWTLAERLDPRDWYAIGVRKTCRWIACARVPNPLEGGTELAPAPISSAGAMAHEEAIQAEAQKADHLLALEAQGLNGPPGYVEAIASTLEWVWRGSGCPPLDIHAADAG
jgi:hypothetical protein